MPQPIKYGGIVSVDNLEAQRRSGQVTDDSIADAMAQASPTIASRLAKVRQRFGGDPAATTAFLNTHFYGVADHNPDKPKGFIGRSLDRIYENYKKDVTDIGQSLENYQQGKQGTFDTIAQTAGNVASIGFSPLAQPFQEGVGTLGKAAMQIPGVKGVVQDVAVSDFVQKGVIPAIQSASSAIASEAQRNPALRTLGAAGEALLDAGDAYAGGAIGGAALRQGANAGMAAVKAIPQVPQMVGKAAGATARGIGKPFGQFAGGFMQGVRGQADNAVSAAASQADNAAKELTGVAKEAVSKGLDEKLVTFAASQNPETRAAMAQMTRLANKGASKLGGDTAHKEVLGGYMLNNLSHMLETKQNVGKAIGAMKMGMADEVIDLTDDFENLMTVLRDKGAVISDTGKITRLMAESDDNIPLLQEALDFLRPSDTGRVARRFKDADMWRSKMFKEMNSAKAKLQPSSSGQSSLSFAEKVVNDLRRSAIKKMSKNNPRFLAYNDAYENLSTESSKFLKSIGYKGKLNIDDISAKDLKAGEIALRTLGNASADVRDAFTSMLKAARKYGYNSNVDEMQLIRYADALEDLYPITPTRSLRGEVTRGTKDALGNFTEDVVRGGPTRAGMNRIVDSVIDKIDTMRGMTPENRFRLLMQILEAPPETPFFKIAEAVLPDELADDIANGTQGIDAEDIAPAIKAKFQQMGLTDDEITNLTQEEKALGIIGGGGDDAPISPQPQAQKSVNGGSVGGAGTTMLEGKQIDIPHEIESRQRLIRLYRDELMKQPDFYDMPNLENKIAQFEDEIKQLRSMESPKALPREGATTGIPKELEPLAKAAKRAKSPDEFIGNLRRMKLSEVDPKLKDAFDAVAGRDPMANLRKFWFETTGTPEPKILPRGKPTPIPGTNLNVEDIPF